VYNGSTCNGDDLDTNGGQGGDQDDILATHSLLSCAADVGTGIFDMSGNVKEWTKAHQSGENPIRGGASNNSKSGISCALNFTLADNNLKLPNIGFRCCR
jgi:formylglycine-generating enzyme required for sulfatase activity